MRPAIRAVPCLYVDFFSNSVAFQTARTYFDCQGCAVNLSLYLDEVRPPYAADTV